MANSCFYEIVNERSPLALGRGDFGRKLEASSQQLCQNRKRARDYGVWRGCHLEQAPERQARLISYLVEPFQTSFLCESSPLDPAQQVTAAPRPVHSIADTIEQRNRYTECLRASLSSLFVA